MLVFHYIYFKTILSSYFHCVFNSNYTQFDFSCMFVKLFKNVHFSTNEYEDSAIKIFH